MRSVGLIPGLSYPVEVFETDEPVRGVGPDLVTRFRWRAERRARYLNRMRRRPSWFHSYRHEVRERADGRFEVQAMQNVAKSAEG